jgi:hypothetical protein
MTKYLVGLILLVVLQVPNALFAQNFAISGSITDAKTGETMIKLRKRHLYPGSIVPWV